MSKVVPKVHDNKYNYISLADAPMFVQNKKASAPLSVNEALVQPILICLLQLLQLLVLDYELLTNRKLQSSNF